jgi:hypothetical protein
MTRRIKGTLSANVLDNGWYVNIHCQTHLLKGYQVLKGSSLFAYAKLRAKGLFFKKLLPIHLEGMFLSERMILVLLSTSECPNYTWRGLDCNSLAVSSDGRDGLAP